MRRVPGVIQRGRLARQQGPAADGVGNARASQGQAEDAGYLPDPPTDWTPGPRLTPMGP